MSKAAYQSWDFMRRLVYVDRKINIIDFYSGPHAFTCSQMNKGGLDDIAEGSVHEADMAIKKMISQVTK
mgnify:CR=1 FL=1